MMECPRSVTDAFELLLTRMEHLRNWFTECPLLGDGVRVQLDDAREKFEAGMDGISGWASEREDVADLDSIYQYVKDGLDDCYVTNYELERATEDLADRGDVISNLDYDPDSWVTADQLEELQGSIEELGQEVAEGVLNQDNQATASMPDRHELIALLVDALKSLQEPAVAPVTAYESKCEVDQHPAVEGPLLDPVTIERLAEVSHLVDDDELIVLEESTKTEE